MLHPPRHNFTLDTYMYPHNYSYTCQHTVIIIYILYLLYILYMVCHTEELKQERNTLTNHQSGQAIPTSLNSTQVLCATTTTASTA